MIDEKATSLKTSQIEILNNKISDIFKLLYETDNVDDQIFLAEYNLLNDFIKSIIFICVRIYVSTTSSSIEY